MKLAPVRDAVDEIERHDRRRPDAPHLGRPARRVPRRLRRQDGAHRRRPLGAGVGGPRRRGDDLRDDPRQPLARAPQRRSREAARLRARAVPSRRPRRGREAVRDVRRSLRPQAAPARRRGPAAGGREDRRAAHRAGRRDLGRLAARPPRPGARPRPDLVARPPARDAAARRLALGRQALAPRPRRLVRGAYSLERRSASSRHDRHGHAQRRLRAHDHRPELPARAAPPCECRACRSRAGRESTSRAP